MNGIKDPKVKIKGIKFNVDFKYEDKNQVFSSMLADKRIYFKN